MSYLIFGNEKVAFNCLFDAVKCWFAFLCILLAPSQVVLFKTLNNKGLMSIATKIAIQLNCKIGGAPWSVPIPAPVSTNIFLIFLRIFLRIVMVVICSIQDSSLPCLTLLSYLFPIIQITKNEGRASRRIYYLPSIQLKFWKGGEKVCKIVTQNFHSSGNLRICSFS